MPQVAGVMVGAWWLGASSSELFASIFGKFAALDVPADGKIDMAVGTAKYGELFHHMIWLGLDSAAAALLLAPVMKRWMRGAR